MLCHTSCLSNITQSNSRRSAGSSRVHFRTKRMNELVALKVLGMPRFFTSLSLASMGFLLLFLFSGMTSSLPSSCRMRRGPSRSTHVLLITIGSRKSSRAMISAMSARLRVAQSVARRRALDADVSPTLDSTMSRMARSALSASTFCARMRASWNAFSPCSFSSSWCRLMLVSMRNAPACRCRWTWLSVLCPGPVISSRRKTEYSTVPHTVVIW
mmetsp:Transcript_23149/g.62770  ORF Transcript_23149/g.62770 Transcript_23149/m.62770 type:complete len:214 (+) Transcript_23149:1525-2166(+)